MVIGIGLDIIQYLPPGPQLRSLRSGFLPRELARRFDAPRRCAHRGALHARITKLQNKQYDKQRTTT